MYLLYNLYKTCDKSKNEYCCRCVKNDNSVFEIKESRKEILIDIKYIVSIICENEGMNMTILFTQLFIR